MTLDELRVILPDLVEDPNCSDSSCTNWYLYSAITGQYFFMSGDGMAGDLVVQTIYDQYPF